MIPDKIVAGSSFKQTVFVWLFKHKIPGTWRVWNFFLTKKEKIEVYRQILPITYIFEVGATLLKYYREKSNLYAYWFSSEKFNLLPNQTLGGVRGVINFHSLFGSYENRTKLFKVLVVDDETFRTFFVFLINIESLVQEWGYRSTKNLEGVPLVDIDVDEEPQFNQRFMKELATEMSRTKAFSNQFDTLYELFQLI